jgi:hypothetical protein
MNAIHFHRWYEHHRAQSAFTQLTKHIEDTLPSYQPPPLTKEQREYMGFLLEEAYDLERPVLVTYSGRFSPLQFFGRVAKIQPFEEWFIIANGEWKKRISFSQLINVDWL